ncbi:hypothetical protein D3C81_1326030 [compost metagenome]
MSILMSQNSDYQMNVIPSSTLTEVRTSLIATLRILAEQKYPRTQIVGQQLECLEHGWDEMYTLNSGVLNSMQISTLCFSEKQEVKSPQQSKELSGFLSRLVTITFPQRKSPRRSF